MVTPHCQSLDVIISFMVKHSKAVLIYKSNFDKIALSIALSFKYPYQSKCNTCVFEFAFFDRFLNLP